LASIAEGDRPEAVVVDEVDVDDELSLTVALNWLSPLAIAACWADCELAASICSWSAVLVARVMEETSTPP
jgi:hypothetical protein